MRYIVVPFFVCAVLTGCGLYYAASRAEAEAVAEVAISSDAGIETPAAAVPPTPVPAPAVHDPVEDPGGFAQDVKGAFKTSRWFFLVVLSLFGLARTLLWASARWSLSWLKRWSPVLVTASGVLASVCASLSATGSFDWQTSLGALFAAAAVYLRPEPPTPKA